MCTAKHSSRTDTPGDCLRSKLSDHTEITATKFEEVIACLLMRNSRAGIISYSTSYFLCLIQRLVLSSQKKKKKMFVK